MDRKIDIDRYKQKYRNIVRSIDIDKDKDRDKDLPFH